MPASPTPPAAPQDASGEPFPLAPMQHAMWVGRQDNQQFGGVAGHLYVEFDGGPTDPDRLRAAATRLALRHPMLRVRFLPDGTQRIACDGRMRRLPGDRAGPARLTRDLVDQRLAAIRDAKSHQQLDGAVFELALTLLPGERSRLHVDLDMQAADAMSYRTLMADLAALYLGRDLPELGYTYREYRQAIVAPGGTAAAGPRRRPGLVGAAHPAAAGPADAADLRRRPGLTQEHPALALAGPGNPRRAVLPCPGTRRHPGDDAGRGVRQCSGALVGHIAVPAERPAVRSPGPAPRRRPPGRRLHLVAAARHRPDGRAHRGGAGAGCAGRHADRRRPFRLPRAIGAARSQPPPRHPGAGAGGVHQRAGTRGTVQSPMSPSNSAHPDGSSPRARRCCWTHRSPSSTAECW